MDKIITIATFDNPMTANLIKAKLQDAGIDSFLANENIVGIQPFYSNAVGGIQLQVLESDAEHAIAILNDITG